MGRESQVKSTRRELRRAVGNRVVEDFNALVQKIDAVAGRQAAGDRDLTRSITDLSIELSRAIAFSNEKILGETAVLRRGIFGRLKWLLLGR